MTSNYQYGNQLKALRKTMCENQTDFWRRFGVTQSRGSRFEQGLGIPPSIMILVELYLDMKVSDADLSIALQNSRQRPMANAPKASQ
jgi:transcriptional regulator with XRE-family HTH domain